MKKYLFIALCLLLAASCFFAPAPAAAQAAQTADLYLHIGSPLALSDGKILPIDAADPDISPRLRNSYTLVPLRFVGEYFNAQVSYDAANKTAIIVVDGQTARFPVGLDSFTLKGNTHTLGTETLLLDGKVLVPLRAICETVLGLPIEYREGVIRIGTVGELTEQQVQEVKDKIGQYLQVESMDELNQHIHAVIYEDIEYMPSPMLGMEATNATTAAPAPTAAAESSTGAMDYAQTNTQTAGVDEGDIIKTDGKYIYSCAGNVVNMVAANGGSLKLAGKIELPSNYSIADMYVDKSFVIVVGRYYYNRDDSAVPEVLRNRMPFTFARVYDISNIGQAKLHREYGIQGNSITTRKQGDYLYLLTNSQVNYSNPIEPRPYVLESGALTPMPLERMLISPNIVSRQLLTLSALNIRDAAEQASSKTIPGSSGQTYMSNKAFYVAGNSYNSELTITRFTLDGAKIACSGSGLVKGHLNSQFSMDEFDGYLRLATTDSRANHLFVLDDNMDICGQVNNYAPGERIYSARFMGQRGYVVTFRQIDPLFVFDLKDPRQPKITGELKVPGFSNYLHPVAENVLLGVGHDSGDVIFRDSSGQETVVGQRTGGLKLSLFDVSVMGKPRELDTLVLGNSGSTELSYNHKAAMFKADEDLLAFPAQIYGENGVSGEYFHGALLISYADNKLSEAGRISDENTYADGFGGSVHYYNSLRRTVYIGDTLYYLQDGLLRAFDLASLKETGRLLL